MLKWPSSFTSALDHRDLSQTMIPPELLNNVAVLMQRESRDDEA